MAFLIGRLNRPLLLSASLFACVHVPVGTARGQDLPAYPQTRRVYQTPIQPCVPCASPTLGTFAPTPYLMVRGNWPTGGGYSPLDTYGDMTLTLYGPISPLRETSAPVTLYSRGYNGVLEARPATSFSNPNLPPLSPVVYPRPANYYYAPRVNRTPPAWSSGMDWIDQQ